MLRERHMLHQFRSAGDTCSAGFAVGEEHRPVAAGRTAGQRGTPSERRFPSRSTGLEKHRVPAPGTEKHRAERHRARKTQGPRNTGPAGADRARDTGPGGSDRLETPASNPLKNTLRRFGVARDTCFSRLNTCSADSGRLKTHAPPVPVGERHMLRRFGVARDTCFGRLETHARPTPVGERHMLRSAKDTCSGDSAVAGDTCSGRPETHASVIRIG